jgi:hypothetical protein
MEDISSMEAEVSSSEAACSVAPSARLWLDDDTCLEAAETCSAPAIRLLTALSMGWQMERARLKARTMVRRIVIELAAIAMLDEAN